MEKKHSPNKKIEGREYVENYVRKENHRDFSQEPRRENAQGRN